MLGALDEARSMIDGRLARGDRPLGGGPQSVDSASPASYRSLRGRSADATRAASAGATGGLNRTQVLPPPDAFRPNDDIAVIHQ